MITILCDTHLAESRAFFKQDMIDYPDSATYERMRRRVAYLATQPVEPDCPDCKLYGLNRQGIIDELDSPDDWLFSDITKKSQ